MALTTKLDRLKSDMPGCRAIVFGDFGTQTVLRTAADPGLRQEAHDRALAEACLLLGEDGAAFVTDCDGHAEACGGESDGPAVTEALRVDAGGIRLMQRGGQDGDDVVVLTLDPAAIGSDGPTGPSDSETWRAHRSEVLQHARGAARALLDADD